MKIISLATVFQRKERRKEYLISDPAGLDQALKEIYEEAVRSNQGCDVVDPFSRIIAEVSPSGIVKMPVVGRL